MTPQQLATRTGKIVTEGWDGLTLWSTNTEGLRYEDDEWTSDNGGWTLIPDEMLCLFEYSACSPQVYYPGDKEAHQYRQGMLNNLKKAYCDREDDHLAVQWAIDRIVHLEELLAHTVHEHVIRKEEVHG